MMLAGLERSFESYLQSLSYNGFRGVIHIVGSEAFAIAQVNDIISITKWQEVVCLPDSDQKQSISQTIQKLLGTEIDALVINAYQGFNPNLLGAAVGCVRAGGVLLLLTPPDWQRFQDPDYHRMLSVNHAIHQISGRFLSHVQQCLKALVSCVRIQELPYQVHIPDRVKSQAFFPDFTEQSQVVSAIEKVMTGHARRPLVIQSNRGRGKSSALGIAAAQLLKHHAITIVITSIHANSVNTVFKHAARELNIPHVANALSFQQGQLLFKPLDEVLQQSADLLLVDEAATIPVELLEQMVSRYKRIVFSTTVQGYEGNGRGFALRFMPQLIERFPQTRFMEMQAPIRYANDDPLEKFCHQALLLEDYVFPETRMSDALQFHQIDRDLLLVDECLLKQIFGLLITAHYQTSPDDLRILLDHPAVSVFIVEQQSRVLAVALVMNEGELSVDHIVELNKNVRRYRGHIIPQTFFVSGFQALLPLKTQRILRIAVQQECRNAGLGKRLLEYIATCSNADFLGASFSVDVPVLRFWQSAGFQVLKLGSHKESVTAQYACIVMRALNDKAVDIIRVLRDRYQRDILYQLSIQNHDCSSGLVMALLKHNHWDLYANDIDQLNAYLQLRCSFEVAQPSVHRFLLCSMKYLDNEKKADIALVSRLFFNSSWIELAKKYEFTGRSQCEALLRARLQELLLMYQNERIQ